MTRPSGNCSTPCSCKCGSRVMNGGLMASYPACGLRARSLQADGCRMEAQCIERLDQACAPQMPGDELTRRQTVEHELTVTLGVIIHGVDDDLPGQARGGERVVLAQGDGEEDDLAEGGHVVDGRRAGPRPDLMNELGERGGPACVGDGNVVPAADEEPRGGCADHPGADDTN